MAARAEWTVAALDARLKALEDAAERGELTVSPSLERLVGPGLRGIVSGMPISDALEVVFQEQESLLAERSGSSPSRAKFRIETGPSLTFPSPTPFTRTSMRSDYTGPPLDAGEAEILTQRIKTEINHVFLLLAEAHDRRAWAALGYRTWDSYVRKEFGYSRSRSYEILDQARVIRAIQVATGVPTIPDVSAYAARQIKPYLQEVIDEISDRVRGSGRQMSNQIINEVVDRKRLGATKPRIRSSPALSSTGSHVVPRRNRESVDSRTDGGRLLEAIAYLASLPPPSDDLITQAKLQQRQVSELHAAVAWLVGFAELVESPARSSKAAASY